MAVTQKIVTSNFNVHNAKQFVSTLDETTGHNYYMFVGKHTNYPNSDSEISVPNNSVQSSVLDVYNDMIFAKRIDSSDVAYMIPNYAWAANTTYVEYSHLNGNLMNENFYTVVDDTTEYNVYKCLSNASNTESTIAPSRVGSPSDLNPIVTGDGYMWKYMYTIDKTTYDKFSSDSYVPVVANTDVVASAVNGTIEVIRILDSGSGYNNYISNATFGIVDINIGGVSNIFGAPEGAIAIDDYYSGCVLKITSGSGVEQFRKIVNYDGITAQKKFVLDSAFTVSPAAGDTYEVYPYVHVWGDGTETVPAVGRAIINPIANTISDIEMLNVGKDYRYGVSYAGETPNTNLPEIGSVYIQIPTVISADPAFSEASLLPIISPQGGHGSDPLEELFARRVCMSTKYSGTESGKISSENDFRQVGVIKDPQFTNVDLILKPSNTIGSFTVGETVYQYKQNKLLGNVDIVSGSNNVIKTEQGKISTTISILNGGIGYNSTSNNELVFDNTGTSGSGASATFANNGSGTITSVTVTSQGMNYETAPTVAVNPVAAAGGSDGQLLVSIANPVNPSYDDSFAVNDIVLINKDSSNFVSTIQSVPTNYQVYTNDNATYTATNAEISSVELSASGVVTSVSSGQITLSGVTGIFNESSKIIGIASSATSVIGDSSSIQINDKAAGAFDIGVQLTRLIGDFTNGSSAFQYDEKISQNSLISYAKPYGNLHHAEINAGTDDDILHITNEFGIFNLDPGGVRTITGEVSGATLDNLSNKYTGDFVKDSGSILYYENIDAITRDGNKSETIKLILEF